MTAPFCASSPEAAALTDGEFWAHVYPDAPDDVDPDPEDIAPLPLPACPVCGSITECAIDDEGRALIHAIPADADL